MCYLRKDAGHPAILCLDRSVSEELMVYGHGIEGMAFFHMDIPDVPPPEPSLSTLVTVMGDGVPSTEMIERSLTTSAGASGTGRSLRQPTTSSLWSSPTSSATTIALGMRRSP